MTKIMLVEDDKSLREIYSIRLVAEGYEVVSAGDGEEALAMAVQQRPDLILSDVMMPKISGFDMLDILRSTPETKDIKVIMMTALSSEDQRQRGENLGADKYLVKSQVGIEDVINTVHQVLGDKEVPQATATDTPAGQAPATPGVTPNASTTPEATPTPAAPDTTPATPAAEAPANPATTPETPAPADAAATSEAPANPEAATEAPASEAPKQPASSPTGDAMEELLSNTPDENNATWPGTTAK
ncbi:response regulator [Candidatus Saccharibacteria bacterium]|nr:response regulator [Candidatus Saccharibacteria bacterium]